MSARRPEHGGAIHVDLLKVQHHGSNHSVDIDFFRKVAADVYVISGNGKHGIPHGDTMHWLSQARTGEQYDVYLTNRTGDEGLTAMLDAFLAEESGKEPAHRYHFLADSATSIPIAWPAATRTRSCCWRSSAVAAVRRCSSTGPWVRARTKNCCCRCAG